MAVDRERTVARVLIGDIAVDATIEEVHTYSASITDRMVETGASISENRRKNPDKLRLVVCVTDHPIDEPASHADGVSMVSSSLEYRQKKELSVTAFGVTATVPGPLNLFTSEEEVKRLPVVGPSAPLSRVQQVYDELRRMHDDGEVFDVVTSYRVFESMGIENLSVPRVAEAAIEFALELKTVRYATVRRIAVIFSKVPAAHKKTSKGKQTPKVVTEEEKKKKLKSFAANLVDKGLSALTGGP